jgi:hypothetical protein
MKKWTIFTILKTVELSVLILFLYAEFHFGSFMHSHFHGVEVPWCIDIVGGLFFTLIPVVIICFVFAVIFCFVPWAIIKNLEWSEKLSNKLKEKTK